jgi:hypothetical protein
MRTNCETGVALCSTRARVKDVEALRALLDGYYFEVDVLVEEGRHGGPTLRVTGEEWPLAVPADRYPPDEPDFDEDPEAYERWHEEVYYPWREAVLQRDGDEGFAALLLALAPHLETPLTVQVVDCEHHHFYGAQEWTVRPGAGSVEVKMIEALDDCG